MVDWLSISQNSGSGNTNVIVEASASTLNSARTTSLVISGTSKSVTIPVYQMPTGTTIILSTNSVEFPASGGTVSVGYTAATAPTVSLNNNNFTTYVSGNNIIITAPVTPSATTRSATLTATVGSGSSTISVSQSGVSFTVASSSAQTAPVEATTSTFTVTGNVVWKPFVSSGVSWLLVPDTTERQPGSASNIQYITTTNSGQNNRNGVIGVRWGEEFQYSMDIATVKQLSNSPENDYLTFTAGPNGGTLNWQLFATTTGTTKNIYYTRNGTDWTRITSSTAGTTVSLAANESIKLRGSNTSYGKYPGWWNGFEGSTGIVKISGNIMSLVKGDNFIQYPDLGSSSDFSATFLRMFQHMTSLQSTKDLYLPSSYVPTYAYSHLFGGCTNMTDCPNELPGTQLTTLCYGSMFTECSGITTAPVLPAQTIGNLSYDTMFFHCSSLNYIKCLATNPNVDALEDWVTGVAGSGTFVKDANTTWSTGTSSIPSGWTVVNV